MKFYERGERPLEIVTSRQWYIRNGGRDPELRAALIARGRELDWIPAYMRARYESWIEGLTGDWLISRQRFFGVPFPVWYRVDAGGQVIRDDPLLASEDALPVDPSTDCPPGYTEQQRDQPNGFTGDPDVMDTWATSSLTPEIATGWASDPDLFARTFPMDLRPQAYDIIRTWLFSTIVRSHFEFGTVPWAHAAISGFVVDAVRYWAANGRPGTDTTFDEGQIKIGRKLAIKVLNVSRFVLTVSEGAGEEPSAVTHALDRSMLAALAALVDDATAALDQFDYARAIERTERFFWSFCDDYVELVKGRAYGVAGDEAARSAQTALRIALSQLLRLFAPFLVYVTEEVWSWWREGSVHRASWPEAVALRLEGADPLVFTVAADVLGAVRKEKSEQKRSLATPVDRVVVRDTEPRLAALAAAGSDVREAGKITGDVETEVGPELLVKVELAPVTDA